MRSSIKQTWRRSRHRFSFSSSSTASTSASSPPPRDYGDADAGFWAFEHAISKPTPQAVSAAAHAADDEVWTTGDVELVTSDGVRFLVPFHLLPEALTALHVPGTPLVLWDRTAETAPVLRLFLQLAYARRIDVMPLTEDGIGVFQQLVAFANKWSALDIRRALWGALDAAVRDGRPGPGEWPWLFHLAAQYRQEGLCAHILARGHGDRWRAPPGVEGMSVWDPAGWPPAFAKGMPHMYVWALAEGYALAVGMPGGLEYGLADSFVGYLSALGDR